MLYSVCNKTVNGTFFMVERAYRDKRTLTKGVDPVLVP